MSCVGEPVSWLRLERYALGELQGSAAAAVADHVKDCTACRASLDRIEADAPVLPPLVAPEPRRRFTWPRFAWGAALAAAAVLLVLVLVGRRGGAPPVAERHVRVKGGEMTLSVVRERDGVVVLDADTFRTSDRLKVRITCTPAAEGVELHADTVVFQAGEDPAFPTFPAQLACGNDVTLPGAFRITTAAPATVCLAIGERRIERERVARRGPRGRELACITLGPE